ncbi:MAG TPA: thioredoxin-dependent thiol peroxidase [Ktedonobacterales bacterium]
MPDSTTTAPKLGAIAPDFSLPAGDGSIVSLASLRGKTVLLYFYPKDDTPGCTTEACSFRDSWGELRARGVVVIGVSRDTVRSHQKFAAKYSLPFPLLADEGGVVAQRYGVWVEKSMYGKTYMSMARTSFLILPDGTIGHVWEKVKAEGHAAEVLAWLEDRQRG